MSLDENKRVVRDFFSHFATNDVDAVMQAMAPEATWWIAGRPEHVRTAGLHSKDSIEQILRRMAAAIPNGLQVTVHGMVAEGEKVAVELESRGELRNGRVYNNQYHTLLTIRDRKVVEVREYLDTQHVIATWYAP